MMKVVMNHFYFLICACSYLLFATRLTEGFWGTNWGRMATQRMIPSMVVDMLLQNNVSEVKIFSASDNVLEAFGGTNINMAITMSNGEIRFMNNSGIIDTWIRDNIEKYLSMNVSFRYVYVGIEPLSTKFSGKIYNTSVDTLELMQKGLMKKAHQWKNQPLPIKATMSHFTDVLINVTKPSEGDFRPEIKDLMLQSCRILDKYNAPIGIDIHPIIIIRDFYNNDIEFAFFENNSTSKFKDGNYTYSNLFEVIYDTFVYALEKAGYPNISVGIGAIGWPTDGIEGGNLQNAQRFHQGLAKFIASNKGTPKRPGPIDAYIHNLADENALSQSVGAFMRHWGIYKFDGQPKFNLDFQGRGRIRKPASAIGLTHMPKRWCILDNATLQGTIDYEYLNDQYNKTCQKADCSAAMPGGSCSTLPFPLNISYGVNMGFQSRSQDVLNNTCNYGGYGIIVADNPSTPNCTFPVEIIAAERPNLYGQRLKSQAFALRISAISVTVIMQFFLFILFTFICTWCS